MSPRSIVGALSLVTAAASFIAGCASLPSATHARGPATADAGANAGAGAMPVSRSAYVRALHGGTVAAGDFRVVVPPGALPDDAIVTVRQPDPAKPVVELLVTPEDRNAFRRPVVLVADVATLAGAAVTGARLGSWNPAARRWEPCADLALEADGRGVRAALTHFSTYRIEAAGETVR